MSTFVYDLIDSIEYRWREVDLLIEKASIERDKNEELYNAICRATVVLIVAHFEGFIKENLKLIIEDVNKFGSFSKISKPMKKTFCNKFIDIVDKGNQNRLKNLIDTFEELNVKLDIKPFLFESNKNPSPNIIDKICNKFGIDNFLEILEASKVSDVFKNDKSENESLKACIKDKLMEGVSIFPYELDIENFNINVPKAKKKDSGMWVEFLDNLLRIRNGIAHGTDLNNSLSVEEIKDMRLKVELIQYSFATVLCYKSIKRDNG